MLQHIQTSATSFFLKGRDPIDQGHSLVGTTPTFSCSDTGHETTFSCTIYDWQYFITISHPVGDHSHVITGFRSIHSLFELCFPSVCGWRLFHGMERNGTELRSKIRNRTGLTECRLIQSLLSPISHMINSSVTQLLLFYISGHNIFFLTTCTHSCFLVTIKIMVLRFKKKKKKKFSEAIFGFGRSLYGNP